MTTTEVKESIDFDKLYSKMESIEIADKAKVLQENGVAQNFLANESVVKTFLDSSEDVFVQVAILSVLALGQGENVFGGADSASEGQLQQLVDTLVETERFYSNIGGIIGYHITMLRLIAAQKGGSSNEANMAYHQPEGVNISQDSVESRRAALAGIEKLDAMAELYPVGGAGDRLNLRDEKSGEALPAAKLLFCGRTLLEGMIRDLQGREYLHYKLFGKQVTAPIAMMTSQEKNNHNYITGICEENRWFGRGEGAFSFFQQPLVPVINVQGNWSLSAPLTLTLKPGGHGVIWKLARDGGVFDWFKEWGCKKVLLRQINNPVAATDHGVTAFTGQGLMQNKAFGFASCYRQVNSAEGTNVVIEKEQAGKYNYCVTNIEYTDFAIKGIEDVPKEAGSEYSAFPSNTNILFADLETVESLVDRCPVPGMMTNLKNPAPFRGADGAVKQVPSGRLESLMQNIADYIVDSFDDKIDNGKKCDLSSFVTFNDRLKTISVTKNAYTPGKPAKETPQGCFFDMMQNASSLLKEKCGMEVPEGANFVVHYHPALGPHWDIIGQKIRGGKMKADSEMQLEIAELDMENVEIDGSVQIQARNVMGSLDSDNILRFGDLSGRCSLHNVKVNNAGIDKDADNILWKNEIHRKESFKVVLRGNAEFHAENVTFNGNFSIEVPQGVRMVAYDDEGVVRFHTEDVVTPSWRWRYTVNDEARIVLNVTKRAS